MQSGNTKKIGIIWSSNKENERRYPVVWNHVNKFTEEELDLLYFEEGYPELNLCKSFNKIHFLSREEIFKFCNIVIITKLNERDYPFIKENQTLFGWFHCEATPKLVNLAKKKKLTLISFENMYTYRKTIKRQHVFCRNNELAGFAGVSNFMRNLGITPGAYGKEMKVAVLGYGSTALGALNYLKGLGASDITVFSKRSKFDIVNAYSGVKYKQYKVNNKEAYINKQLAYKELNNYDLIINCILQNNSKPVFFLKAKQIVKKKDRLKIVDISCDLGLGFDFATPTTFTNPIIYADNYIYSAVDNLPSLFYKSASFEISGSINKYIKRILNNDNFENLNTLKSALDIKDGIIVNKDLMIAQEKLNKI